MADTDRDTDEEDSGESAASGSLLQKHLSNKKMLMIDIIVVVLLLVGIGAGLYFFVFSGGSAGEASAEHPAAAAEAGGHGEAGAATQVAYFDLPDILVNIQGADGSSAYLKMSLSLELPSAEEKAAIENLQPRITDQLQGYLRELRTDDLKGSAGVLRVKEEMLRRVEVAASPYHVRDVLLKEMVIQ